MLPKCLKLIEFVLIEALLEVCRSQSNLLVRGIIKKVALAHIYILTDSSWFVHNIIILLMI